MYYRVAIHGEAVPAWKWKSSVLESINILLQWLHYYHTLPTARLRVFSSLSADSLRTQLVPAEDQPLWIASIPASQLMSEERMSRSSADAAWSTVNTCLTSGASDVGMSEPIQSSRQPDSSEIGSSVLERRREELEYGAGGDHDCPYQFSLSPSLPHIHSWVQLWMRVQHGDLRRDVAG
jgi:hypothetical protein